MMRHDTREDKLNDLAAEVLDHSRGRLLINLRYMDVALSFHGRAVYDGTAGTDGKTLFYGPSFILRAYRDSKEGLTRTYLHTVLHCVFHHMFVAGGVDSRLWDLACDIAVESTIDELALICTQTEGEEARRRIFRRIRKETGFLTAEKIYSGLRRGIASGEELGRWEELMKRDDHSLWYEADDPCDHAAAQAGTDMPQVMRADQELEAEWRDISERIAMDAEMFARVRGRYASSLVQNLRAVLRERYDYSDFLRKFAVTRERVKVSEDEFDYIYYMYGLSRGGRMPLIEPVEYREDSRIHDFVIAIDTSGSVAGEQVQSFLQKTYSILKSREAFDNRINVHIIQCDAAVQSDEVITSEEDLERYIGTMEIKGLGGTDFRPVFDHVDELAAAGEFRDLRGLIYFTDGLGTFPQKMPEYKTAFVFVESGYEIPEVPQWAMKVVLRPEELQDQTL